MNPNNHEPRDDFGLDENGRAWVDGEIKAGKRAAAFVIAAIVLVLIGFVAAAAWLLAR